MYDLNSNDGLSSQQIKSLKSSKKQICCKNYLENLSIGYNTTDTVLSNYDLSFIDYVYMKHDLILPFVDPYFVVGRLHIVMYIFRDVYIS